VLNNLTPCRTPV